MEIGFNKFGRIGLNKNTIKNNGNFRLNKTLSCDTVSFSAMKKAEFSGIDLFVVNKFKAPVEKFNSNEDLQNWCKEKIDEIRKKDLATSFQNAVVEVLVKKTMKAVREFNVNNVIVAGGVAANKGLRERLEEECSKENINLSIPSIKYCTDNATMIAASGYYAYLRGDRADLTLNPNSSLELKNS